MNIFPGNAEQANRISDPSIRPANNAFAEGTFGRQQAFDKKVADKRNARIDQLIASDDARIAQKKKDIDNIGKEKKPTQRKRQPQPLGKVQRASAGASILG